MQITKADVTPIELNLNQPVRMAGYPEINQVNRHCLPCYLSTAQVVEITTTTVTTIRYKHLSSQILRYRFIAIIPHNLLYCKTIEKLFLASICRV